MSEDKINKLTVMDDDARTAYLFAAILRSAIRRREQELAAQESSGSSTPAESPAVNKSGPAPRRGRKKKRSR